MIVRYFDVLVEGAGPAGPLWQMSYLKNFQSLAWRKEKLEKLTWGLGNF
jgi:hypothetical protein